ncbi:MAG: hypothetical protein GXY77_11990 [Fibrobacter sp.]|nr:hypothetical protein [Fibrobacter sp.]
MGQQIYCEKFINGPFRNQIIWDQIRSYHKYSESIPCIESIVQKNTSPFVSEWIINIDGVPFTWQQMESFEQPNGCLKFELTQGDFDQFHGHWKVECTEFNLVKISFHLEYSLGIPVIEDITGNIIQEKLAGLVSSMLDNHIKQIENTFIEERRFERFNFGTLFKFSVDNTEIVAELINLSRGGMLIKLIDGVIKPQPGKLTCFKLAGFSLDSEYMDCDMEKCARVIFCSPLSQKDLNDIFSIWKMKNEICDDMISFYKILSKQKTSELLKDPI